MDQFNYFFFIKYVCMLKKYKYCSRSASDLMSMDAKYCSG